MPKHDLEHYAHLDDTDSIFFESSGLPSAVEAARKHPDLVNFSGVVIFQDGKLLGKGNDSKTAIANAATNGLDTTRPAQQLNVMNGRVPEFRETR